jgi:hypothetical protein
LAYVTGLVNQRLLQQNEYLAAESSLASDNVAYRKAVAMPALR